MRIRITIFLLIGWYAMNAQQQPLLTQFMYGKSTINPAFAGVNDAAEIGMFLREQWLGLKGAPSYQVLSFETPIAYQNSGVGALLQRQSIGVSSQISLQAQYAYHIRFGRQSLLSMGMQAGVENTRINFNDPDIYLYDGLSEDELLVQATSSGNGFIVGAGLYYSDSRNYIGLSVPTLYALVIGDDESLLNYHNRRQVNLMGGHSFTLDKQSELLVQFHSRYVRNFPFNLELNANWIYNENVETGLSYRLASGYQSNLYKSVSATFGFRILKQSFLTLSYDYDFTRLRAVQWGSLEVGARYQFDQKKIVNPGINPRFF